MLLRSLTKLLTNCKKDTIRGRFSRNAIILQASFWGECDTFTRVHKVSWGNANIIFPSISYFPITMFLSEELTIITRSKPGSHQYKMCYTLPLTSGTHSRNKTKIMGREAFITDLGQRQKTIWLLLRLPFQRLLMCTIIANLKMCCIYWSICHYISHHKTASTWSSGWFCSTVNPSAQNN